MTDKIPSNLKVYHIFVSSPGDLAEERQKLQEIVLEVNGNVAHSMGFHLDVITWEKMSPSGESIQNVLERAILDTDLFILLIGHRWGTPIGEFSSGVEFEFETARRLKESSRKKRPDMFIYFKTKQPDLQTSQHTEQIERILSFKKEISRNYFYSEFKSVAEWSREFRTHLVEWLNRQTSPRSAKSRTIPKSVPKSDCIDIWIDVGNSTKEDIAELYDALAELHRAHGGTGITFRDDETKVYETEEAIV
jgi:hypothetical protein